MIEAVAVPERLDGAPSQVRRRWSTELKEQAVAESLMPGANVSVIARRIGVQPSQLFAWRKALCRNRTGNLPQRDNTAVEDRRLVEIVVGDIVIRCDTTIDEQRLQRLIRVVRSA
jgi:transposase